MIFVDELFKSQNIICPEWLSHADMLENEWLDSEYTLKEGIHTWRFKNVLKDVEITFDGETYIFGAYRDNNFYLLTEITEEYYLEV